jgi:hypothetical protein
MKKVANLFSALIIVAILPPACASRAEIDAPAEGSDYGSRACWWNQRGEFEAFLVLARARRIAVPYFVSGRCSGSDSNHSYGQATILRLNTIRMIDRFGRLQSQFPRLQISDNVRTDLPAPSPEDRVFYFKARVVQLPAHYQATYAATEMIEVLDTHVSFSSFLTMPRSERDRLYNSYAQRSR